MSAAPKTWQALLGTAVLGVERAGAQLPALPGGPGALAKTRPESDPAGAMLTAAALLSVYLQAGQRPGDGAAAPAPAPGDDLPLCSPRAGQQLGEILCGDLPKLLPEWCGLAAAAGLRAPDELLPALLRAARARPKTLKREALQAVLGKRGCWLAARHPDWAAALSEEDHEAAWDEGAPDQRLQALASLREEDAERARGMLEASWDQEATEDRVKFLAALETGLSDADEPFLEAALDDKNAKVRQAAALLLARLPRSRYGARMADLAKGVLVLEAKKGMVGRSAKLAVTLPGELDKAMRRDGLSSRQHAGLGKRASLLLEIVAGAPLSCWDEAAPADWIAAAQKGEWSDAALRAWALAAQRQGNAPWAEALLEHFAATLKRGKSLDGAGEALAAALEAARPEACESAAGSRLGDRHLEVAAAIIDGCTHDWSPDFSKRVLAWLKTRLLQGAGQYDWRLRDKVKAHFGLRMAPRLAEQAAEGWPLDSKGWSAGLDEMVDQLSRTLRFRADMREEMSP